MLTSKNVIERLNRQFAACSVDLLKYVLKSDAWWQGQNALLLKTYVNFSGDVIKEGTHIQVLFKMQEQRFDYYIHHGMFYVRDTHNVEIGGIHYSDMLLLDHELRTYLQV